MIAVQKVWTKIAKAKNVIFPSKKYAFDKLEEIVENRPTSLLTDMMTLRYVRLASTAKNPTDKQKHILSRMNDILGEELPRLMSFRVAVRAARAACIFMASWTAIPSLMKTFENAAIAKGIIENTLQFETMLGRLFPSGAMHQIIGDGFDIVHKLIAHQGVPNRVLLAELALSAIFAAFALTLHEMKLAARKKENPKGFEKIVVTIGAALNRIAPFRALKEVYERTKRVFNKINREMLPLVPLTLGYAAVAIVFPGTALAATGVYLAAYLMVILHGMFKSLRKSGRQT